MEIVGERERKREREGGEGGRERKKERDTVLFLTWFLVTIVFNDVIMVNV